MRRETKKHLFDIKTSIDSINDFLGGHRDFFEYQNNKLLRRAIEREIETSMIKVFTHTRIIINASSMGIATLISLLIIYD